MDKNFSKKNNDLGFNNWPLNNTNYIIFFIGFLTIIIGYIIMALGTVNSFNSLSLAPILLFIGYIILIPLSIFYKTKSDDNRN